VVPFSEQGLTTYLVMEEQGWFKHKQGGKKRGVKHARTIMRFLGRQYGLIGREGGREGGGGRAGEREGGRSGLGREGGREGGKGRRANSYMLFINQQDGT
jgi:hypothetical protein